MTSTEPLNICLLSYRSNPHSGGQGVYLKNLSRALKDNGHRVTVISGPPKPDLDPDIDLVRLPCLDLYDPADPFRMPSLKELCHPINLIEWIGVSTMGFPEPFTFGLRAWHYLRRSLGVMISCTTTRAYPMASGCSRAAYRPSPQFITRLRSTAALPSARNGKPGARSNNGAGIRLSGCNVG